MGCCCSGTNAPTQTIATIDLVTGQITREDVRVVQNSGAPAGGRGDLKD